MQRIQMLLQKINELSKNKENALIDVDLMLDYTKVLYADLLEIRGKLSAQTLYVSQEKVKESTAPVQPIPEVSISQNNMTDRPAQVAPKPPQPEAPVTPTIKQKDVRNAIGINDKYQFISELFGNDKEAYDAVIEQLNTFATYEQAKSWLERNVHNQQDWESDHETVISFYATLHLFFANN